MKIFNIENGQEKVYVQLNDIRFLNTIDLTIPRAIYMKLLENEGFIVSSNMMEFFSFDDPSQIQFFRGLDFILDYNEYRKLTEQELDIKGKELLKIQEETATIYNEMSDEDKKANHILVQECKILDYMMSGIREFYELKRGKINIPFPQVPDSNGFKLSEDDYKICASLDPNIIYLFRKDGKPLDLEAEIPRGFFEMGMVGALNATPLNDMLYRSYSIHNTLSEDKTKLIIKFEFKNFDKPKLISSWEELAKIPANNKYKIEVNVEKCYAWIKPIIDSELFEDYHYLSTHTFYGTQYQESTEVLQNCGFNVELDNWDNERAKEEFRKSLLPPWKRKKKKRKK